MSEKKITKIEVNGVMYTPYPHDIETYVTQAHDAAEQAGTFAVSAKNSVIATQYLVGGMYIEEFDKTKQYSKGDSVLKVIYDTNGIPSPAPYLFIANENLEAGEWNPSFWTQTSMVQMLFDQPQRELVRVRLVYTNLSKTDHPSFEGKEVSLTIGTTTTKATIDDKGYAYFEVSYGEVYTISVPFITGYNLPKSQTRKAGMSNRYITFEYSEFSSGYSVIGYKDNKIFERGLSGIGPDGQYEITDAEYIKFLKISTSVPLNGGVEGETVSCLISVDCPLGVKKQWCNSAVEFDMDLYTGGVPPATPDPTIKYASTDYNGQSNTQQMEEFISLQATTGVTLTSTAVEYCREQQISFNILNDDGTSEVRTYTGYLPATGQMYFMRQNISEINDIIRTITNGVHEGYTLTTGYWWSSTQFSATHAWNLYNGSLNGNGFKNGSYSVLPLFDL